MRASCIHICHDVSQDVYPGLLSNQEQKSINLYFTMDPLRKKSIKEWYSKAQYLLSTGTALWIRAMMMPVMKSATVC